MCGIIGIYNYKSNEQIIEQTYNGLKKLNIEVEIVTDFLFII